MANTGQPATAAKHTPGPWEWDGNTLKPSAGSFQTSDVHSILDAEGGYGYLGSKLSDTLAELDADRQLIAAAPCLLAALRDAHTALSAVHLSPHHKRDVLAAAADAIAKATGSAA